MKKKQALPLLALTLAAWLLPSAAQAKIPVFEKELYSCQKAHGTAPKLPVASAYPGGFTGKLSQLTPAEVPGAITVNPKAAACLVDAMGEELIVLAPMELHRGIDNAYLDPASGLGELKGERLASSRQFFEDITAGRKSRPILVYCHHTSCMMSYNAVLNLRALGYENLLWMREGQDGWIQAGLPVGYSRDEDSNFYLPKVTMPQNPRKSDSDFPQPFGRERDREAEQAALVKLGLGDLCDLLRRGPKKEGDPFPYELALYRAAGIDLETDTPPVVRRKIGELFEKNVSVLLCYGSPLLQMAALAGNMQLLSQALTEWRLPIRFFNRPDPQDNRTVLDVLAQRYKEAEGENRKTVFAQGYALVKRYGGKTSD
ncbi:rhodanese-like domain-containing protein [Roseateles violae]|uniref:Rhodanese-like domain-containing protein n=1 Tax=Roseateles violae TaxID=3058042 RepID=A0ABT8DSM0_9BURK|nr:rhodanese-like domain-containing protein [Pelomonas sp. PFR6]MDN3921325.1 rhodanese-like domain-containing protein [Pelomonas sp. PFR6]